MRLTLHTDYALRMLIFLAVQRGRPSRVSDVSKSFGASRNHLLKVALKLGKLGYVTTVRGRSGGIALAQAPENINLGAVVRQIEDGFVLVECMHQESGLCVIAPACRLKGVVKQALDAFLSVFDSYSLAEIVENRDVLAQLLEPPGAVVKSD